MKLLEKDIFKAITPDKIITAKEVTCSIQVFNPYFADERKDPYTNKADEKSCQVEHSYNDGKTNLVLMYSRKILKASQSIGFCFTAIIYNNKNDNIRFYSQDITQTYNDITSNLPDFYIWPIS